MFPPYFKHSVWSTAVPSVTTGYWSQLDWIKFEDGFRPKDYTGDRYDEIAWNSYMAIKNEELRRSLYAEWNLEHICEPLDENLSVVARFKQRESAKLLWFC